MSFLPATGDADETYSVSDLCGDLKGFLGTAFGALWVVGEVGRVTEHRSGHLYFELVEKGAGDRVEAKIDCVIWRSQYAKVKATLSSADQRIAEGQEIRVLGGVDFWPGGGRLQFVVRQVDPVFTLGLLARRRMETLEALKESGLLELNKELTLSEVPVRIALVTSHESAAYHDFLTTLAESGFRFEVLFVHASVQGARAERELLAAISGLAAMPIDCLVLTRGGGSKSDLAVFDSRPLAEALARLPIPVVTGLGHEIDQAIADLVAHTALKTPTKAAEFLIDRVATADRRLERLEAGLARAALDRLRDAREALGSAERGVGLGRRRLERAASRLDEIGRSLARLGRLALAGGARRTEEIARRLGVAAPRLVARRRGEPEERVERIATAARGRLREATATLRGHERLVEGLSPRRLLERGFSITRTADGAVLRDPGAVQPGDTITTELAAGGLTSRVEDRAKETP
jgi:exodeoxyribonuclease VII large subunit